jgi:hypothetical protein
MPALDGVWIKLDRANQHLAEFGQAVSTLDVANPELFHRRVEGNVVVFAVPHVPRIDPRWTAIAGDALTSLMAALDHLAWQLALLDGQTPGRATYFPAND